MNYDPRDLVLLVSSFAATLDGYAPFDGMVGVNIEQADFLREVAEVIADVRMATPAADSFVWAYEVAEPLGDWLATVMAFHPRPSLAEVRALVCKFVAEAS